MTLSMTQVTVSATTMDPAPTATVTVSFAGPTGTALYVGTSSSSNGISSVTQSPGNASTVITINFNSPLALGVGVYNDTVTVRVCYDQACTQPISNSPQTIAVQYTVTVPPPVLDTLTPSTTPAGGLGFTLTATGSNFISQSVLQWNGALRATTFLSTQQLTAQITSVDLTAAGTVNITVSNGASGAVSKAVTFTVTPLPPLKLSSMSPTSVAVGGGPFTLTLLGAGFAGAATVNWNGSARTTTYVSSTELLAQVTAADIASAGTAAVTVVNFAAAGGTSAPLTLTIAPASIDAVALQMNATHAGVVNFKSVTLPAASTWSVNVGGPPSYALIAAGKVFVTISLGSGSELIALDQATGATVWGPIVLSGAANAAYDAGKVFVVSSVFGTDAIMQAYDATSGHLNWSAALPGQYAFSSGPTAANGIVVTGGAGSGGTLYALDEATGALLWTQPVANGDDSTPVVSADGVYVTYPCSTYAFRPATGESLWSNNTGCEGGGGATAVLANGVLYSPNGFGNYNGDTFNAETGALLGTYVANNLPAIGTTTGYFLQSSTLRAVTLSSNTVVWSFAGDGMLISSPIVVNQYVFIGSSSGNLYALDAATGSQVWMKTFAAPLPSGAGWGAGIPISGLAAGDGLLVVPSGNTVTAYTLSTSP